MAKTKRVSKENSTIEVGIKPVNLALIEVSETDCFGKEYDNTTKECCMCADNILCATYALKVVQPKKAKIIQPDTPYLSDVDMEYLTDSILESFLLRHSGVGTITQLYAWCKKKTNCPDDEAIKQRLKRFKADNPKFTIQKIADKKIFYYEI
jgi:hypothetical protein